MKLRKMLALSLAAALTVGMAVSVSAAELDTAWYAANNADVVAQVGDSAAALKQHYDTYGRKEGRMANAHDVEAKLRKLFDAEEYAALYPDVKEAFGEDEEAMFGHYISYGLLETRRPCMKVSYEAAVALKEAVAEAMEKAGLDAVPGSEEAAAFLEGEIETVAAESAATVEALTQAAVEVETAVAAAEASAEAPVSSGSSNSSSSSNAASEEAVDTGRTVMIQVYENVTLDDDGTITGADEPVEYSVERYYGMYKPQIDAKKDSDGKYCCIVAVPCRDTANMHCWVERYDSEQGSRVWTDITYKGNSVSLPDGYIGIVLSGTAGTSQYTEYVTIYHTNPSEIAVTENGTTTYKVDGSQQYYHIGLVFDEN